MGRPRERMDDTTSRVLDLTVRVIGDKTGKTGDQVRQGRIDTRVVKRSEMAPSVGQYDEEGTSE